MLVAVAAVLALVAPLAGARSAEAADGGYRYWSFWTASEHGEWRYAQQGPAGLRPDDGEVVGFRFTASRDAGESDGESEGPADGEGPGGGRGDGATPRPTADFREICADNGPAAGRKRVALVVDPGTGADAPSGEKPPEPRTACALLEPGGSAADALAAEAPPLRYDSSALLCAIEGYPKSGCGERISGGGEDGPDSSDPGDDRADGSDGLDDSGPTAPLYLGVGVLILLAAGAARQVRRRRP
ncbi:hypothetical protein JGS22_017225 [Streptomyces sp. P38-E01]|uniref:Secreted protein n=1 Tax=Streptomyces tardus TaxID=2780544 RepID=A0A949JI56_9ACTN|nr:hypothetical protein [Streptomyces tardus]